MESEKAKVKRIIEMRKGKEGASGRKKIEFDDVGSLQGPWVKGGAGAVWGGGGHPGIQQAEEGSTG